MRIQTIGDIHGEDIWHHIIDIEGHDKVIFLGDYVDAWEVKDEKILSNLMEIINLKKEHPDKIELLLGNHDNQYMFYPRHQCSGFRPSMQQSLFNVFNANKELFKAAYQYKDTLWTHAGVTTNWFQRYFDAEDLFHYDNDVAAMLNELLAQHNQWLFVAGWPRGGRGPGGPFWADDSELWQDPLHGMTQVVGHTHQPEIKQIESKRNNATLWFVDVLQSKNPDALTLNL